MSAFPGASLTAKVTRRPTVGGRFRVLAAAAAVVAFQALPASAQTSILFIGNSFTYGELTPSVQNYKTSTVTDLVGTNIGGVPALFKQMTVDRGLNYNVFLETQPGSNLDFPTTTGSP